VRDHRLAPSRTAELAPLPVFVLCRLRTGGLRSRVARPDPQGSEALPGRIDKPLLLVQPQRRRLWEDGDRPAGTGLSHPRAGEIETAALEIASEATRLDLEIVGAEEVAEALADRLGRGEITLTRYDVAIKPVDDRIARLRAERAALPEPEPRATAQPLETSREQWTQRWDKADHKEKRDLLKMALRGKRLVVAPADRGRGSTDQADIVRRVTIE
jgi:hypothetical protein